MVLNRVLCSLFFLAFSCGMLLAQAPATAHTLHTGPVTPARLDPAGLKTIYTNLGPSVTDLFNDTSGYEVTGPNNSLAIPEQWIALPFKPKVAAHVTVLQAAIGWQSGSKQVKLGLYSDNAGVVGTLIAGGHSTNLPTFGTCCQVVSVTIASTAVTAGTQYWIVATSNDTNAPDLTAVWQSSNEANYGYNVGQAGWSAASNNWPGGAAKGTIP
jgi:hypothetical protein